VQFLSLRKLVQRLYDRWTLDPSGLSRADYQRERELIRRAWQALQGENLEEAERLAKSVLDPARSLSMLHFGRDTHRAHLVLGHLRLLSGDVEGAERELLLAADEPKDDPSLYSFGPDMSLASALLDQGRTDIVITYIERCSRFWRRHGARRLRTRWIDEIRTGKRPDFGSNEAPGFVDASIHE
jgi:hypothetical protein